MDAAPERRTPADGHLRSGIGRGGAEETFAPALVQESESGSKSVTSGSHSESVTRRTFAAAHRHQGAVSGTSKFRGKKEEPVSDGEE